MSTKVLIEGGESVFARSSTRRGALPCPPLSWVPLPTSWSLKLFWCHYGIPVFPLLCFIFSLCAFVSLRLIYYLCNSQEMMNKLLIQWRSYLFWQLTVQLSLLGLTGNHRLMRRIFGVVSVRMKHCQSTPWVEGRRVLGSQDVGDRCPFGYSKGIPCLFLPYLI